MNTFTSAFRMLLISLWICGSATSSLADLKPTGVPRFDDVVEQAVDYLQGESNIDDRNKALVAYALLKAGVPKTDPHVSVGLARALAVAGTSNFDSYQGVYEASVCAMLLADWNLKDPGAYKDEVQKIIDRIATTRGVDGAWGPTAASSPDTSLTQYCVLALWAAQRCGCDVDPALLDGAAYYLANNSNYDGGWAYRPGQKTRGAGSSTANMTLAATGSIAVARLLFYSVSNVDKPKPRFGVLKKKVDTTGGGVFPEYEPQCDIDLLNQAVDRGLSWHHSRSRAVATGEFPFYFYYTMERAAALASLEGDWFTRYGDGLMTLQQDDGRFNGPHVEIGPHVGTSFAILYYMRSTQQILTGIGAGFQHGGRDLTSLFGGKQEKKKDLTSLGALLDTIQNADLEGLENLDAEDVVESVTFGSREELIGQVETLKKLLSPQRDAATRQAAYFALGRTGDYALIPLMLKGLRDPSVDVNVEAINALRYISRKPNGFGLTLTPFRDKDVDEPEKRVRVANYWRDDAVRAWGTWYRGIRPYEESDGLDEIRLLATP